MGAGVRAPCILHFGLLTPPLAAALPLPLRSGRAGGAARLAAGRAVPHQLPPRAVGGARGVQGQGVREGGAPGKTLAVNLLHACMHVCMHVCAPREDSGQTCCLFACLFVCILMRGRMHALVGVHCSASVSLCPLPHHPAALQELAQLGEGHPPLREVREVAPSDSKRDSDRLVPLVAEAAGEGHSVLVFCSTRKHCESAAALIADLLPQVRAAGVFHCRGIKKTIKKLAACQRARTALWLPGCACTALLLLLRHAWAAPAACTAPVRLQIAPPQPEREAELAAQRQTIIGDIKIAMGGAMSAELEKCMLQGQSVVNPVKHALH